MQEEDDISGKIARYEMSMDEVIERLEKRSTNKSGGIKRGRRVFLTDYW